MKILIFSLFLSISLNPAWAVDCSNPPNAWGSNYSNYASWCRACGGTPYNNNGVGCRQGSNWGGGGGGSTGNPAVDMMTPILQQGIQQMFTPKQESPEEAAARQEREREYREQLRREAEEARAKEELYQKQQDIESITFMDTLADSLKNAEKSEPEGKDFRAKIQCKGGEPGLHTCYVFVCGGAFGGDPVCCPEGYPKLNECDCNCYPSNADFECKRYAACQYSYKVPDVSGGAK